MNETKKCAQCGQEKPIEDFSESFKNMCRACVAEKARVVRQIMNHKKSPRMPSFYCGRGIEIPIPEDATFVSPMRFQASVAAMQGMLASSMTDNDTFDEIARKSVACADALFNELTKKKDENNQ